MQLRSVGQRCHLEGEVAWGAGRLRLIGPFWRCGELGHLAVSCTKQRPVYPFDQPWVSEAADSVTCLIDVSGDERGPFGHIKV